MHDATQDPHRPSPRLVLHIGMPKSGTTSLQTLLAHQRESLARVGISVPVASSAEHFLAALEVTGKHERWGRTPVEVAGAFDRLLDRGRASGLPTVVMSHELLAQALPHQVPEILAHASDFEVEVVITARDLGRVLPAAWQEWVKNGHKGGFDDFVALKARRLPGRGVPGEVFWRIQNVAEVLERWLPHVAPTRVHLVTCPRPGTAPDELWRRFADVLGCPAGAVDPGVDVPRCNESIPAAQVTLLAAVNRALAGRLPEPHAERLRKHWLAEELLAGAEGEKAVSTREALELFAPVARSWARRVVEAGVVVHGHLDDLEPRFPAEGARHPDDSTAQEQLREVPEAIAAMLLRIRELEVQIETLAAGRRPRPGSRTAARLRAWVTAATSRRRRRDVTSDQ